MILYHGGTEAVMQPDCKKGRPDLDFGQGFYLSADKAQALRMAEQKTLQLMSGTPVVSEFEFDEALLHSNGLNVKIFEDYSVEWARFILRNRNINESHPIHDYDIVYGPIADDGVTFQLRRYQAGILSIEELVRELQYARAITFQYFFGTELALSKLIKL